MLVLFSIINCIKKKGERFTAGLLYKILFSFITTTEICDKK